MKKVLESLVVVFSLFLSSSTFAFTLEKKAQDLVETFDHQHGSIVIANGEQNVKNVSESLSGLIVPPTSQLVIITGGAAVRMSEFLSFIGIAVAHYGNHTSHSVLVLTGEMASFALDCSASVFGYGKELTKDGITIIKGGISIILDLCKESVRAGLAISDQLVQYTAGLFAISLSTALTFSVRVVEATNRAFVCTTQIAKVTGKNLVIYTKFATGKLLSTLEKSEHGAWTITKSAIRGIAGIIHKAQELLFSLFHIKANIHGKLEVQVYEA